MATLTVPSTPVCSRLLPFSGSTSTVRVEVANLKRIAMKNGMKTLHQDSIYKVKQGMTTIEEALAKVPPDLIL